MQIVYQIIVKKVDEVRKELEMDENAKAPVLGGDNFELLKYASEKVVKVVT